MLFPTHLVAAVLLSRGSGASTLSPLWLVVGASLPDVIDKPLATVGLVDVFHSVGHSAFLLVVAVPLARYSATGLAVGLGWASHLCLDALHIVINGRPDDALFLLWPVVLPADPLGLPPVAFARYYLGSPSFYLELVLWFVLGVVLVRTTRAAGESEESGTRR